MTNVTEHYIMTTEKERTLYLLHNANDIVYTIGELEMLFVSLLL